MPQRSGMGMLRWSPNLWSFARVIQFLLTGEILCTLEKQKTIANSFVIHYETFCRQASNFYASGWASPHRERKKHLNALTRFRLLEFFKSDLSGFCGFFWRMHASAPMTSSRRPFIQTTNRIYHRTYRQVHLRLSNQGHGTVSPRYSVIIKRFNVAFVWNLFRLFTASARR